MDDCPYCGLVGKYGVCSPFNPIYMVHDDLWTQSGLGGHRCILCFEKAIGRRIRVEDLKPSPLCNHQLPLGWFLGDRPFGQVA